MAKTKRLPWAFLDEFRGADFAGEWPTLPEMFAITTKRFGARPCFTDFEGEGGTKQTLSYEQVLARVRTLAAWLCAEGVEKGDRVAVTGKNSPEWATAYLAAMFAGATVCPIDYALSPAETENLLNAAQPKFLFVDEEKFAHFAGGAFPFRVCSLSPRHTDVYAYNLATEADVGDRLAANKVTESDLAVILFTSGTTGTPKGVMLTHKNLVSDAYIATTRMTLYETDVFYALLPIHHAYTMLAVFIEAISVGAEVVFGKSMAVSRLMRELKEGQITMLLGVPLLFNKLLAGIMKGIRAKGALIYGVIRVLLALSYAVKKIFRVNVGKRLFKAVLQQANIYSLRIAICGGGPLAASVFKVYNEMGIDFVQGYGLTETSPIITLNPVDHFKIESVGQYFFPWMEMKILDPAADGVGEVCVKGPMVFQGYYNLPEETAKVFTEDGWFRTGDLGWLDDEGYLMLAGRAKNMIVTEGGKNVYPKEIENAFQLCGDIEQITVLGYVADAATKSEQIEALIYASEEVFTRLGIARAGNETSPAVLAAIKPTVDTVNRTLQPYARISKITLLERPLEMTTTQKVKRTYAK